MITGRVLITGGAGFLGRGIMRRAAQERWPVQFTVYSRDEYKQSLCKLMFPQARYVLGDIRDEGLLTVAMAGHDTVIHAGALKYIPEAEINVSECISVNVEGSACVISAARHAGVKRVVAVSTDKAVNPINVYGMTKALMERLFMEARDRYVTIFTSCRYGNVVGSTGSVIPVFQRQLNDLGRITVTDPNMTRFWISVDEAVDLIDFALDSERIPGSVTVPRPRSMKLSDVAEAIAQGRPIKVIGPRLGEKQHEQLIAAHESIHTVIHESYYEVIPADACEAPLNDPFELVSSDPDAWMDRNEMSYLIEDAARV